MHTYLASVCHRYTRSSQHPTQTNPIHTITRSYTPTPTATQNSWLVLGRSVPRIRRGFRPAMCWIFAAFLVQAFFEVRAAACRLSGCDFGSIVVTHAFF